MNVGCLNEQPSKEASIVLSLWFSLSGLAAVTGNAVVLWLFYKNETLRTISNRFLASLSVADLLVGLVIDPLWIAFRCLIQPSNVTQTTLDKFMDMLWIHTTAATTLNLCCVSVDRFIAIRFPFRYLDILTKRICRSLIVMVWFTSLLLPFPVIFVNVEKLWLFISLVTFFIPATVLAVCYIWIFKAASNQARRITGENVEGADERQSTSPSRTIQNYKAIKTIGLVLGVFVVSWMPCLTLSIVHEFIAKDPCIDKKLYNVVWPWIEAVALSSSAINPWIYYFRNSDFREALHRGIRRVR
ncbi:beta-2 adrenergic receptor-like [Stylophora pistillata]|uniref:beta-2 adrenergic receptor-like n=1 Tax=Stylophora pistillata TaxID=50429 RepID=UPI000C03FBCF|nr:beta-2 adrenergic receptor-like [Stylophora pistillata]